MGIEENPMNRVLLYNPKATKIAAFAYDGEEVTPVMMKFFIKIFP